MNTKVLLLGAVMVVFTGTTFATDALLSPRAQASQNKVVPSSVATPLSTIANVDASSQLSPRAQANQIKVIKGVASNQRSTLECRSNMPGSPRAVGECSQHATMPGCLTVAVMK